MCTQIYVKLYRNPRQEGAELSLCIISLQDSVKKKKKDCFCLNTVSWSAMHLPTQPEVCGSQQSSQNRGRCMEKMRFIPESWKQSRELVPAHGKLLWPKPTTLKMSICNEEYILHRMHLFGGKGSKRRRKKDSEAYLSAEWTRLLRAGVLADQ